MSPPAPPSWSRTRRLNPTPPLILGPPLILRLRTTPVRVASTVWRRFPRRPAQAKKLPRLRAPNPRPRTERYPPGAIMAVNDLRRLTASVLLMSATLLSMPDARAAGFEVGESTARSLARGGTGAVNKSDPSALYFNPALLPRARGHQLLLNANALKLNVGFQRDDLVLRSRTETRTVTFDRVENEGGIFPAPFLTASFDVGPENFALALGVFGLSAYGAPCYGTMVDGECAFDPNSPARG